MPLNQLPGTDGFRVPPGMLDFRPPAPAPQGPPQEELFAPPTLPSPPVEPDTLQTRSAPPSAPNLPTGPSGNLAVSPGDSDSKGKGLGSWLPLILGTLGGGLLAGKNQALTDFGVNLLQGAADTAFSQSEEKRKRKFELETADLKQGYEVIKDLMGIDEGSLVTLENEIRNDPNFSHMAAYIRPLREAKAKYQKAISMGSDGDTKITAKEAQELAHYYNAVKGAKEFINKHNEQKEATGFAGQKAGEQAAAKIKESYAALKAVFPDVPEAQLQQYFIKAGGPKGLLTANQLQEQRRSAVFAVEHGLAKSPAEALLNPDVLAKAQDLREIWLSKQKAGDRAQAQLLIKETPAPPGIQQLNNPETGKIEPYRFNPATGQMEPVPVAGGAGKDIKLDSSTQRALEGSTGVANKFNHIEDKLDALASRAPVGFLQGRVALAQIGGSIPSRLTPEETTFLSQLGITLNKQIQEISGTAVSAQEATRIAQALASPVNNYSDIKAKIKAARDIGRDSALYVFHTNPGASAASLWGHAESTFSKAQRRQFDDARNKAEEALGAPLTAKQKIQLLERISGSW